MCIILAPKCVAMVNCFDEEMVTCVVVALPIITILDYVAMEKLPLKVVTLNAVVEQHFTTCTLVYVVVEN